MVRRLLVLVVMAIMASSVLTIAGCESLREAIRTSSDDKASKSLKPKTGSEEVPAVDSDVTKVQAVDADAKHPRSFFQNNRRAGGWSSEAREIEGHLGVGQ
jgi:hypothetical protein